MAISNTLIFKILGGVAVVSSAIAGTVLGVNLKQEKDKLTDEVTKLTKDKQENDELLKKLEKADDFKSLLNILKEANNKISISDKKEEDFQAQAEQDSQIRTLLKNEKTKTKNLEDQLEALKKEKGVEKIQELETEKTNLQRQLSEEQAKSSALSQQVTGLTKQVQAKLLGNQGSAEGRALTEIALEDKFLTLLFDNNEDGVADGNDDASQNTEWLVDVTVSTRTPNHYWYQNPPARRLYFYFDDNKRLALSTDRNKALTQSAFFDIWKGIQRTRN